MNWLKLDENQYLDLATGNLIVFHDAEHAIVIGLVGEVRIVGSAAIVALRARLDRLSGEQTETDQRYRAAHWQRVSEAAK